MALVILGLPAPAVAEEPSPAGATVISLANMGTLAPLAFYGDQGTAVLTIPVPPGLLPTAFTATVELPVNVRTGTLTVTQDDRTISRVALPAGDQAPISIPLAGAQIVDNAVSVTIRTYLVAAEGYCLDPTNPLRLTNGAVTFAGGEAPPAGVSNFLPPVLRKLTIAIPAAPSRTESDAAVRLSAAITARYGRQSPIVSVASLAAPQPPSAPFERVIVIQQGPETGLALAPGDGPIPRLRISGSESELTNQVRLLSADVARLAMSSKAVVGPLKDAPQLPGDVTTLRSLGQPVVSAVALAPQVSIGLDQTRMGRSAHEMRVHLMGSYTPIPNSISARLVAVVGGETIDRWPSDNSGTIDRWVSVPDRLLERYTTLGVSLNIAGNTGRCGEFQPLTLTIDGDSVVQSQPAMTPVPAGFQSLPQALMPQVQIGIGPDVFADTVRATAIIVGLQRMSALPLDTVVTDIQQAIDSRGPAILIAADGWDRPEIMLPVSTTKGSITIEGVDSKAGDNNGGPTTLALDPELRYGSLQAFFDGRRSLLVATSNATPAQLDELLRWMVADPGRWPRLDGIALVSAPGRPPVTIRPQVGVADVPVRSGDASAAWWAAGGIAAVAMIGYALIWWRSRRSDIGA
ncbi:MAG: hypothetical protein NT146_07715 [Mycobacterium sp.]|nr:hypothetical protein [Mycobacterium sp.]